MSKIGQRITGFQHIGLPTNDMEKTIAFYTSLGFSPTLRTTHNGEEFCFLALGNICVEAIGNGKGLERPGAIEHVALDVDDVEAAWQAVKEAGFSPLEEEIQFLPFWENGVRFFNILGPNQEKIEFSQVL